jgi:hypothetical protein
MLFVQLFKDAGMIDKAFTQTDCDLIFTKGEQQMDMGVALLCLAFPQLNLGMRVRTRLPHVR